MIYPDAVLLPASPGCNDTAQIEAEHLSVEDVIQFLAHPAWLTPEELQ